GGAVGARLRPDRLLAVDDERRPVVRGETRGGGSAERELAVLDRGGEREQLEHGVSLPCVRTGAKPARSRHHGGPWAKYDGAQVGWGEGVGTRVTRACTRKSANPAWLLRSAR